MQSLNSYPLLFQNFTIIYIKMGYPRLTVQEQLDLLPLLWKAIQGKPNPHKYRYGSKTFYVYYGHYCT